MMDISLPPLRGFRAGEVSAQRTEGSEATESLPMSPSVAV